MEIPNKGQHNRWEQMDEEKNGNNGTIPLTEVTPQAEKRRTKENNQTKNPREVGRRKDGNRINKTLGQPNSQHQHKKTRIHRETDNKGKPSNVKSKSQHDECQDEPQKWPRESQVQILQWSRRNPGLGTRQSWILNSLEWVAGNRLGGRHIGFHQTYFVEYYNMSLPRHHQRTHVGALCVVWMGILLSTYWQFALHRDSHLLGLQGRQRVADHVNSLFLETHVSTCIPPHLAYPLVWVDMTI